MAWKPEIHHDYTKYLLRRVLSTLGSMIAEIIGKNLLKSLFFIESMAVSFKRMLGNLSGQDGNAKENFD